MATEKWTGGCQCGAVRYEFSIRPERPCICHCRMCQKQFGNVFGAFTGSDRKYFKVTRGTIARFRSSEFSYRGFCRDCGTPLTYDGIGVARIAVSLGSLDRHSEMKPEFNYGAEGMEPWLLDALSIPCTVSGSNVNDDSEHYKKIKTSNRQHPDHDTEQWPPEKA